jgi:hypothetical protein
VLEILGSGFSELRIRTPQSLVSASRARPGAVHLEAQTVREVARRLALFAPAIPPPEVPPDAPAPGRAALQTSARIVAIVAAFVAIVGSGAVMVALRDAYPPVTTDLYRVAVPVAAGLFAGAVLVAALAVRGHSDSLRTLGILSAVLLYALPCYTVGAVLGINGALDDSAPARRRSRVVERWATYGKRAAYHLRLAPLRRGEDAVVTEVDRPTYAELAQGDAVTVVTGEGALGWEWLQRVERLPAAETPPPATTTARPPTRPARKP